jgi:hypothetical protein
MDENYRREEYLIPAKRPLPVIVAISLLCQVQIQAQLF